MSPHRERGPQEVTPVRLEPAPRPAPAALQPARPAAVALHVPPAPPPPDAEEIARDATAVRRRALATVGYGVGALLATGILGAGVRDWSVNATAFAVAGFCGLATIGGTLWTWMAARRLGDAGVSVFDAIDGSWKEAAGRAPSAAVARAAARQVAAGAPGGAPRAHPDAHRIPAAPEVLASRWGANVTRAVEDRAAIGHLIAELGPADRDMIPDVLPSADVLVRRVGELATTLHDLDREAPPSLVADVEARLAAARAALPAEGPPPPDQARRLDLLQRQVETLADLAHRREQLTARLESASLVLQTMRLDLLRLRSAGIESALGEITAMTRDAGTLSRDIGRALDVAEEIRKADG